MKRLLIICIALLLPVAGLAWMNVTVGGGGVPAVAVSCTTSTDGALEEIVTSAGATSGQDFHATRARAQSVIIGATSTITEYIVKLRDSNKTGNVSISLFTDSSGVPGSQISGTEVVIPNSSVGSEPEVVTATLETPKTGISSGTYWIVFVGTGTSPNFSAYADMTTLDATSTFAYDTSYPSSWSTLTDRDIYVVIMGCAE